MVGKGIWEDVFAYVSKASKGKCETDGVYVGEYPGQNGQRSLAEIKASFEFDIQPICLLHSLHKEGGGSKNGEQQMTGSSSSQKTLFFVVPSTSSRVLAYQVGYLNYSLGTYANSNQLPDKILLFQLLRKRWEELKAGAMTKSVEWQIRVVDT